jgi:urease accessory protein UreH
LRKLIGDAPTDGLIAGYSLYQDDALRIDVIVGPRVRVETAVRSKIRPLMFENFVLEPDIRSIESTARLGGYTHTATFFAFQVGRSSSDLRQLESILAEVAREASRPGVTIWGASALASDGVIVRGLSATARDLPATLARFWTTARRFLTGEEAVPPRKMK